MQYLGQHFLKNEKAVRTAIAGLALKAGDTVIEIGPGEGALTIPLAKTCARIGCRLVAVEKDKELVELLMRNPQLVSSNWKPEIIHGDILTILPSLITNYELPINGFKVIGNIPYYITGHLLRIMSELKNKPSVAVLMVQKEVAERICVKPGEMNLLAAATQVWAEPKLLLTLKPGDFEPAPAVHSAVIELSTRKKPLTASGLPLTAEETEQYYATLHRIFKQPRKMLINNLIAPRLPTEAKEQLSRLTAEKTLMALNIPLTSRPQDLTIADLLAVSKMTS